MRHRHNTESRVRMSYHSLSNLHLLNSIFRERGVAIRSSQNSTHCREFLSNALLIIILLLIKDEGTFCRLCQPTRVLGYCRWVLLLATTHHRLRVSLTNEFANVLSFLSGTTYFGGDLPCQTEANALFDAISTNDPTFGACIASYIPINSCSEAYEVHVSHR